MSYWQRMKYVLGIALIILLPSAFFLYGKIDFEDIVWFSLVSAGVIEAIYDVKNRTVDESDYGYSSSNPHVHQERYLFLITSILLWVWVSYDIYVQLNTIG